MESKKTKQTKQNRNRPIDTEKKLTVVRGFGRKGKNVKENNRYIPPVIKAINGM